MAEAKDKAAVPTRIVACPVDGALNRVPATRLGQSPKCGVCGRPLFQGRSSALTSETFDRHAAKSDLPVVVDFWAAWCGPCRVMAPNFEAAAARLEPRVRLTKLDTVAEPALAERFGIRGIPCLIVIHKGRELARTSGVMSTDAIVQWVEEALAKAGL